MNTIEKYYNKFNEDKRLNTRHGIVEFTISMEHIKKHIKTKPSKILDIGAGTGKYSIALSNDGHDVTAIDLVKKNISVLKQKTNNVKAYQGNSLNLSRFKNNSFDIVILFGPLYHLFREDEKIKTLLEAKRVLKDDGVIFVAYLLSDYAFIRHAIMDNYLRQNINDGKLDKNYNILTSEDDLYSYVKLQDINKLNKKANLKRKYIFSPDGPTDYIRNSINKLSDEDFNTYIDYQRKNCKRKDLLGVSSHVVDVLIKGDL